MNKIYLYDGKFSSLMVLIYDLLNDDNVIIKEEKKYMYNLLEEPVCLKISKKEEKYKILKSKLDKKILYIVSNAFLSSNENKETIIYNFIKLSFKYGASAINYRNIDYVNEILNIATYVRREAHRMKGFLRFKKMKNNFYYAVMSPTNNILSIVANHFKTRLSSEYFIICDEKRKTYALYDKKNIYYFNEDNIKYLNLDLSSNEDEIIMLWKTFFNTIGIKERQNKKSQMNFMPKKYWKNIIEMEDEYEKGN